MIIVEYDYEREDQCFSDLTSLYGEFVSSRRRMLRELKKKSTRDACQTGRTSIVTLPAPLLVLLSIDASSQSSSPLKLKTSSSSRGRSRTVTAEERVQSEQELQSIEISSAVARVHGALQDIIGTDSASNSTMPWYVQPYDRTSSLDGPFRNGVYPGMNWLIRAMQKQNCTHKSF